MNPVALRLLRLVSFGLLLCCGAAAIWVFAVLAPHHDPALADSRSNPHLWGYVAIAGSLLGFGGAIACHLALAREPYTAEPML